LTFVIARRRSGYGLPQVKKRGLTPENMRTGKNHEHFTFMLKTTFAYANATAPFMRLNKERQMKKTAGTLALLYVAAVIFTAGCGSVKSGAREGIRDGVREGISGLFRSGGGGSGGGGSGSSGGSGSGGSGSGGISTAPERNYSGNSQTVPWPSDAEWGRYGLSGLRQPPGTDVSAAALYQGAYHVGLINGGKPAFENLAAQIEKMAGAELMTDVNTSDGRMAGYRLNGGSVQIIADFIDGDIAITASK
jgi:hypothetical protein